MANNTTTKNTCLDPVGYPGPTRNASHPGVFYQNKVGTLGDAPALILKGPKQCNGTIFVDSLFFKSLDPVSPSTNPINVTVRLVTYPPSAFISDNDYDESYVGLDDEDIDCFSMCPCGTMSWHCRIPNFYLKGDQALIVFADRPDLIRYTLMYREEL